MHPLYPLPQRLLKKNIRSSSTCSLASVVIFRAVTLAQEREDNRAHLQKEKDQKLHLSPSFIRSFQRVDGVKESRPWHSRDLAFLGAYVHDGWLSAIHAVTFEETKTSRFCVSHNSEVKQNFLSFFRSLSFPLSFSPYSPIFPSSFSFTYLLNCLSFPFRYLGGAVRLF